MWETALIHQTGEILTAKPTFIQGVSEKLLKNGEHKLPPVHIFIWLFSNSLNWKSTMQCSPFLAIFLDHPVFITNKTNTRTKRLTLS